MSAQTLRPIGSQGGCGGGHRGALLLPGALRPHAEEWSQTPRVI